MNRRDFIRNSLASLAAAQFFPLRALAGFSALAGLQGASPIVATSSPSTSDFTGDEFDRAHQILWNKDGYLRSRGGIPAPSIFAETVVVGGGMSGLLSAYLLRDKKPIVLEQASRFGGNSKGEAYLGSPFSIGAAYLSVPERGGKTESLLNQLGLLRAGRLEADTSVFAQGHVVPRFWDGGCAPGYENHFRAFYAQMREIGEKNYPDLPYVRDAEGWDRQSFQEWLTQKFHALHPLLAEFLELYCWSSFAADPSELSAYQALNFLSADIGGIVAFPGGNALIAQRLAEALSSTLPAGNLQSGALVIDVAPNSQGVQICFEDAGRNLRTIQARNCIYAAPKFTVDKVVQGMDPAQLRAIEEMTYRAYIVGNIILKKPIQPPSYDVYSLQGAVPPSPSAMRPSNRAFTDVCFSNWSYPTATSPTVLTAYKAFPYQGARQFLFSPDSHRKHAASFSAEVARLLPALGLQESDVAGIRMTRWGHAVPVAARGLLSSGVLSRASAPVAGRIFFANQDNFANPSFESALEASWGAAQLARRGFS